MTKQEEIRKEIAHWQHSFNKDFCMVEWDNLEDLTRRMFFAQADALLCRLEPMGVVIKADGELPEVEGKYGSMTATNCKNTQVDMLKAGYVAVESLIEEAL